MKSRLRTNRFERYPRATLAGLVFLGFLLLLPLTDLAFGVLPKLSFHARVWLAKVRGRTGREPETVVRTSHPIYHHGLKPMRRGGDPQWRTGAALITNSLGMRDKEQRVVPLKPDKYRVLFIGDSFLEGHGMSFEHSWYGRVEEKLRALGVDSLNAGVSSYAPTIFYSRVKHLIETESLQFQEIVVALDLSDIQDETFYSLDENDRVKSRFSKDDLINRYDQGYDTFLGNLIHEYTVVGRRLLERWQDRQVGRDRVLRRDWALHSKRSLWTVNPFVWREYGERGMKQALSQMDKLFHYLAQRKIPMTVVVHPWPDQVYFKDLNSLQVKYWEQWTRSHGAGFINLFPVFVGRDEDVFKTLRENYLPEDCHWNVTGNRRVAEAFWRAFEPGLKERTRREGGSARSLASDAE